MKENDKMRTINDKLEFFRSEVLERYENRPAIDDIEGQVIWQSEMIMMQSLWIKTLENKIHAMRREE